MINYLVNQDESALMVDDYKRLYPYLYGSLIEYWAKRRGLETSIVFSLIKAESSFEKNAVSRPGAVGLMQVMPSTANDISKELKYFDYNLKTPKDNIIIGTYYLKKEYLQLAAFIRLLHLTMGVLVMLGSGKKVMDICQKSFLLRQFLLVRLEIILKKY